MTECSRRILASTPSGSAGQGAATHHHSLISTSSTSSSSSTTPPPPPPPRTSCSHKDAVQLVSQQRRIQLAQPRLDDSGNEVRVVLGSVGDALACVSTAGAVSTTTARATNRGADVGVLGASRGSTRALYTTQLTNDTLRAKAAAYQLRRPGGSWLLAWLRLSSGRVHGHPVLWCMARRGESERALYQRRGFAAERANERTHIP